MNNTTVKNDEDIVFGGSLLEVEREITDKRLTAVVITTEGGTFRVEAGQYSGLQITAPTVHTVYRLTGTVSTVEVNEDFAEEVEAQIRKDRLLAEGGTDLTIDEIEVVG